MREEEVSMGRKTGRFRRIRYLSAPSHRCEKRNGGFWNDPTVLIWTFTFSHSKTPLWRFLILFLLKLLLVLVVMIILSGIAILLAKPTTNPIPITKNAQMWQFRAKLERMEQELAAVKELSKGKGKEMMFIPTDEDHPTSFPENDGDQQLNSVLGIAKNSFEHPQLSNVVGNSVRLAEARVDHYDNARGDEASPSHSVDVTATTHSSPSQQHIGLISSLPFRKTSLLWGSIESMVALQVLPQQPHFCPLEQYNEEAREGIAIGKMLIFANLVKETMELQLDVPRTTFESKLEALTDIEDCGFTVQPIRSRLEELLRIKDSCSELLDNANTVEREVHEEKLKFDELQEYLQILMARKEAKGRSVAELQGTVDAIKERIQGAILDFNRLAASPW